MLPFHESGARHIAILLDLNLIKTIRAEVCMFGRFKELGESYNVFCMQVLGKEVTAVPYLWTMPSAAVASDKVLLRKMSTKIIFKPSISELALTVA